MENTAQLVLVLGRVAGQMSGMLMIAEPGTES